ncbi:VWA domain-containing protein [Cohnella lubricantis]|uniref:VWA domain-containing protein n=1 Tax=Cohnella lubricantis TaxID=2163172 RepID=A0A841T978_9BACL|nr:VWA domain-containing protein [Cohnella lubricantis]MBB6675800.1 VWA domain-containing protein [Cohnella lubricantis]MBP2119878.1 Ca-activated chloride channel family protein [Cohnella lubricantis]
MANPILFSHSWNRRYLPCGGTDKVYLLVELTGRAAAEKPERAPINIGLVLDRSGSMEGLPLEFSKKACQYVTEQVSSSDVLSMVAFDDEVLTVFPPEKVTHKDLLKKKIASIQSGGSTNLSGGMIQGAQYVHQSKQDGMVNRILLLSDGHANQGITDRQKLAQIAREYRSMGVGISTLGVGHGFDEDLMEGIADEGGGNFYYIERPDDIPSIFAKELQGVLTVVAQNVRMKLKPTEYARITNVYGYQVTEDNGAMEMMLGDIYDSEVKSILIEMMVYPHSVGSHPLLDFEWDYVDITEGVQPCQFQLTANAEFTNHIDLLNMPLEANVEKHIKITETALAIEKAMNAFDQGDVESGKTMLQSQADDLLRMAIQTDDTELREESKKLYERIESIDHLSYSPMMRKELHSQKYRNMKRKK